MSATAVWRMVLSIILAIIAIVLVLAAILLGLLLFAPKAAAQDIVLEVRLGGFASAIVVGHEDGDSLYLPAADVYTLVGLSPPAYEWATPQRLEHELRVPVRFDRRRMVILIEDNYYTLPASRRYVDERRAEAEARPSNIAFRQGAGMFGSAGFDERGDYGARLGYGWRRVSLSTGWNTIGGASWAASINPVDPIYISCSDSELRPPQVDARLVVGRSWVGVQYINPDVHVSAATALGPVVVFGDSRERAVVTYRGPHSITSQLGWDGEVASVGVTFGRLQPSTFLPPRPGSF